MLRETRATNAATHLAHLQAQTHMLIFQLAKEPNFCRHITKIETKVTIEILVGFFKELVNKNVLLFLRLLMQF